MQYANVRSEVIDYLVTWTAEHDIDAIMDAIEEEAPDASTIDDIDPDTFTDILESNEL